MVDFFTGVGIEIGMLVPVDTGLPRGILDANRLPRPRKAEYLGKLLVTLGKEA